MLSFDYQKRVRYGETDQMGYLYYGNYAQYYEIGRVEFIRELELTYKHMEEVLGILMPVMSLNIRYVRPARYDELITIRTMLRTMPGDTITFHHELFNEREELINGGTVKLCFIRAADMSSVPAPDYLTEKLKPYFAQD